MNLIKLFPLVAIGACALVGCEKKQEDKGAVSAPSDAAQPAPQAPFQDAAPATNSPEVAKEAAVPKKAVEAPTDTLTEDHKTGIDAAFKEMDQNTLSEIKQVLGTEEGKKMIVQTWKSSGMSDAMIQGMLDRASK